MSFSTGIEGLIENFGEESSDLYSNLNLDAHGDLQNPAVQAKLQLDTTEYENMLKLQSAFIKLMQDTDSTIISKIS